MVMLGKSRIIEGEDENFIKVEFDVSVNKDGLFTTTLKKEDVDLIESFDVKLGSNNRFDSRNGFFIANTKKELINSIREVLKDCISRELIEEEIVIRYAINTTASFGFTKDGKIIPNLRWDLDGEIDEDLHWQYGTEKTHASNAKPIGIQFYVKPCYKRTYKYRNEKKKVEYDELSEFGQMPKKQEYYLSWLQAICSVNPPRHAEMHEMEYTEERAKFFVEMFKSLCKIAHTVAQFIEPEKMIKLAESGKYLMQS